MLRFILILALFTTPVFAAKKQQVVTLPCGCPEKDYNCPEEIKKGRSYPGPVAGVITSMKCCPGLWTVSAIALVVGGVAYAICDSSDRGSSFHAH